MEEGCLLCICVDVVHTILRKVYESLAVLILLLLVIHEAVRDVVHTESLAELSPRHLVAIRKGGGEGCPLGTRRPAELLGHEYHFLHL
jgi:hypothetical protein